MQDLFAQTVLNSLVLSLSLALFASGISLVYGILLIVNFAHGELFMLGAFVFWLFSVEFGINPVLAVLVSMIGSGLLAVIVERIAFRPIRGQMTQGFISCLGIILILQTTSMLIFGVEQKSVRPFPGFDGIVELAGITFPMERVLVIIVSIVGVGLLWLFLSRHRWGKALQALAQDQEAAALQGISIDYGSALAMGIGGALAGLAASVLAPLAYVEPTMGAVPVLKAFVAIVIGGIGSLPGAILGCLLWGFFEGFGTAYLDSTTAYVVMYMLFIVIILWRPFGLLGRPVEH